MIVKAKSIREQVYDELKESIVNGEIHSGEKIIEQEYAKKFGVSRTPLREALRMLELEGLVTMGEKGGVVVNYVSEEDIREIYRIRVSLEAILIEEIIQNSSQNLISLQDNLKQTQVALEEKRPVEELIKLFSIFNEELYALADMKHVVKLIHTINQYTKRFRVLCLQDMPRLKKAYREHCELVLALEERNLKKALKLNEKHLLFSQSMVLNKMCENDEEEEVK